jgi:hypothetical protein
MRVRTNYLTLSPSKGEVTAAYPVCAVSFFIRRGM